MLPTKPSRFALALIGPAVLAPALGFAGVAIVQTPDAPAPEAAPATNPTDYQPCLDYWQVGAAGKCAKPEKKAKPAKAAAPSPTLPVVVAPAAAPVSETKSKSDTEIDKFLDQYGKPPREFVAFYLNPTPENAMKWAHTYNEILTRNSQLAIAWTQAEKLYQSEVEKGVPASKFTSTTLPPVPDYGIPIPGFTDNPAFYPGKTPPGTQVLEAGVQSFGGQATMPQLAALTNPAAAAQGLVTMPREKSLVSQGTIELRYYFSAECPYCQKFEPELAGLLKEMGNKLATTCIDVTPYAGPGTGPDQSHVAGKLDCAWRTLEPGEEDQFGITQTPTLLIRRTPTSSFERVSGYVPAEMLRNYLMNAQGSVPQVVDAPLR